MSSCGIADGWTDCLRIWEGLSFPIPEELLPFSSILAYNSPSNALDYSLDPCPDDSHEASAFSLCAYSHSITPNELQTHIPSPQDEKCLPYDVTLHTHITESQVELSSTATQVKLPTPLSVTIPSVPIMVPDRPHIMVLPSHTEPLKLQYSSDQVNTQCTSSPIVSSTSNAEILKPKPLKLQYRSDQVDTQYTSSPTVSSTPNAEILKPKHKPDQADGQRPNTTATSTLRCVLLNTWSMVKHATDISSYITENDLDILFLTETWLSTHTGPSLSLAIPDDYFILSQDRLATKGGGVAVIYRRSLNIYKVQFEMPAGTDALWIKLSVNPNTTFSFVVLYRPPYKMPLFYEQLLSFLTGMLRPSSNLLLMGDFNYWLFDKDDPEADSLEQALTNLGFDQLVSSPTHIKGHTLDWLCSHNLPTSQVEVQPCPWSDHFFVSFVITLADKKSRLTPSSKTIVKRNMKKLTKDLLGPMLSPLAGDNLTQDSPEELASLYNNTLKHAVDTLAPLKVCKILSTTNHHVWFNENLKILRANKNKALRTFHVTPTPENRIIYSNLAKTYKTAITTAKKEYFDSRISSAKSNSKEIFKVLRELEAPNITPEEVVVKDNAWCETIQAALLGKVESLKTSINARKSILKPVSPPSLHSNKNIPSFSFSPVTEAEVTNIINSLKPTTCQGDVCPSLIVKECAPFLVATITRFINASFESSLIPADIKQAWITPLLKKPSLDPCIATNYRPITNVPFLLKIIDRVAYLQIQAYLETFSLFGSRQSGFRAVHSTETALIDLKATLLQNMDKGSVSLLMLLDLSAAFDLVDFDILINRLTTTVNFSQKAAEWVLSFLSGRQARVFSEAASAMPVLLSCGVPQGSCLSPTLYNIFTKPLFDLLDERGIPYANYADDTQFVLTLTGDYAIDSENINQIYSLVQSWMAHNGLALNDSKTELLIVGTAQRLRKLSCDYKGFTIAGCFIPVAPKVKTLGVLLDSTLSMKAQVNSITSASSYYLKLLRQLGPFLSTENRAHIARAIVSAKIDYCSSLLQNTGQAILSKLQVLQNNAVRAVNGLCSRDHVSTARRELHWLPVRERVTFRTLTITYKCLSGNAPAYLKARLNIKSNSRPLRSNALDRLEVPQFKLATAGDRSFDAVAPRLWNSLPPHIQKAPSIGIFKSLLKTHLFT